jgi:hypothetical protein
VTPAGLNGTWQLTIRRHTFAVTKGGAAAASGSAQIAGARITFRDIGGPLACRGAQASGVYTWRLRGAKLTLARVYDPCLGRRLILGRSFTRVS